MGLKPSRSRLDGFKAIWKPSSSILRPARPSGKISAQLAATMYIEYRTTALTTKQQTHAVDMIWIRAHAHMQCFWTMLPQPVIYYDNVLELIRCIQLQSRLTPRAPYSNICYPWDNCCTSPSRCNAQSSVRWLARLRNAVLTGAIMLIFGVAIHTSGPHPMSSSCISAFWDNSSLCFVWL